MDLRVKKTKQNIEDSFFILLEQHTLDELTVNELLATALINRSTFYTYYRDKYDLAEQIIAKYLKIAEKLLHIRFSASSNLQTIINEIYLEIQQYRTIYLLLFKLKTDKLDFASSFQRLLKAEAKNYLAHSELTAIEIDYIGEIYAAMIQTTISWSLTNNENQIEFILPLLKKSLLPLLEENTLNKQSK
ncbi:TetR/AcrR family transcriptional regulator [Candidatus Enterococcus willemsii]|uniref:HTH tetR-type domain-containing protein n=1 Tax=Candidatus Enterococcus willemsii TaxID=1857215 RepID=A0ABQ6YZ06_9ENTE|nr:TetR family transcriptional regulator [Enterococcus sp. CU12B]KAF1303471.1 hypothetical protein BAU17_12230 [Enterococcus sp. CU12B]